MDGSHINYFQEFLLKHPVAGGSCVVKVSSFGGGLIPGQSTSTCCRCSQKKKPKQSTRQTNKKTSCGRCKNEKSYLLLYPILINTTLLYFMEKHKQVWQHDSAVCFSTTAFTCLKTIPELVETCMKSGL